MEPGLEFVEANGIRFAYLAEGRGPLALLFHGFPDTAHTWDDVRPLIAAKGYRAVSPFLRGYRPTAIPPRDADGETLARDALGLIEALGAKEATLIGHDWGATAVYGAAALAPDKVRKPIAMAIPHPATLRPSPRQVWAGRHFAAYKLSGAAGRFARDDFAALSTIVRRWSPKWSPTDAELAPVRECFADAASRDAAFGYYRTLTLAPPEFLRAKIRVPTVVFCGDEDPMASRGDFARAAGRFEREYVLEEMAGGHFFHREHPATFAERLLRHL